MPAINKLKNTYFLVFCISIVFANAYYSNASSLSVPNTLQDSTYKSAGDSIRQYINYNSNFLDKTEIEHQKLIRNILLVCFIFMVALLVFTMFFYGSKIKKISNILVLQDDALKSTKDQLVKIINIFNYIDQQVYITDSKGTIEWINSYGSSFFKENYDENKINLIQKFAPANQKYIELGQNEFKLVDFKDSLYTQKNSWKMIPIKNSKGEFSNMVFIC